MKTQKVFIPVKQKYYDFVVTNIKRKITANSNDEDVFIPANEREGYFFTSDELKDVLLEIDGILAGLEDWMHGKDGEKVTHARKLIAKII